MGDMNPIYYITAIFCGNTHPKNQPDTFMSLIHALYSDSSVLVCIHQMNQANGPGQNDSNINTAFYQYHYHYCDVSQ